jgi:hypothetical protein
MTTKGDSLRDAYPDKTSQESAISGVRKATARRKMMTVRVGLNLFLFRQKIVLRAVWLELRSLCGRIAILRRNNWFRYGILLTADAQGNHMPLSHSRKYLRARIRGIQTILSIHPAATLVDHYLLIQATALSPECLDRESESNARWHADRRASSIDSPGTLEMEKDK